MRVYGRIGQQQGLGGTWVTVTTDANGDNSNVYLTALIQDLKLNLGESPFFANDGIPAQESVITQAFPDYYVMQAQKKNAQNFASLIINRVPDVPYPSYSITAVCNSGAILQTTVAM